MEKGKRNIMIVIVLSVLLDIVLTLWEFHLTKNIGVFNILVFISYFLVYQSLYFGKKWARYLVLFFSYWNVFEIIQLLWHPIIGSRKLVPVFWVMSFIGIIYLGIALFLTFNKDIKHYLSPNRS